MAETLDRVTAHLAANGVDLSKDPITLGAFLTMDRRANASSVTPMPTTSWRAIIGRALRFLRGSERQSKVPGNAAMNRVDTFATPVWLGGSPELAPLIGKLRLPRCGNCVGLRSRTREEIQPEWMAEHEPVIELRSSRPFGSACSPDTGAALEDYGIPHGSMAFTVPAWEIPSMTGAVTMSSMCTPAVG